MTYILDGVAVEKQPVVKRFRLKPIGTRLDGSSQKSTWQFQLNFEIMSVADVQRIGGLFLSGTPIGAVLQNPATGEFQSVSGVTITSWNFVPSTIDTGFGSLSISLENVDFG